MNDFRFCTALCVEKVEIYSSLHDLMTYIFHCSSHEYSGLLLKFVSRFVLEIVIYVKERNLLAI